MATKSKVRWLERIDRPCELVTKALAEDAKEIFHLATNSAASRAGSKDSPVGHLHSEIAGMEFQRDIIINIKQTPDIDTNAKHNMVLELEWKSAEATYLFPTMRAKLHVLAVGDDSMLDFRGEYDPPFGVIGQTIDAMLGFKIAETSVQHLMTDVANQLRTMIPTESATLQD